MGRRNRAWTDGQDAEDIDVFVRGFDQVAAAIDQVGVLGEPSFAQISQGV